MAKLKTFTSYFACAILMIGFGYFATEMLLRHANFGWLVFAINAFICAESAFLYYNISEPEPYNHIAYGLSFAGVAAHIVCFGLLYFNVYGDILPLDCASDIGYYIAVFWIIRFMVQMYVLAHKPAD